MANNNVEYYSDGLTKRVRMFIRHLIKYTFNKRYRRFYPWREIRNKRFGQLNKGEKIYIIRRRFTHETGILNCYVEFLTHLEHALENEYKPVIDMQNAYYRLIHNSEVDVGKINAWEMFFQNTSNIRVEDAYKSYNVTLSLGEVIKDKATSFIGNNKLSDEEIMRWHEIDRRYNCLKPHLKKLFDISVSNLLCDKRVLAVSIRDGYQKAADFKMPVITKAPHPVQPCVDEVISDVKKYMTEWNCEYIFVSTISLNTLEKMEQAFRGKILYVQRNRMDTETNDLEEYNRRAAEIMKAETNEQRIVKYLEEVYLMSKCTALIGGKSSSTTVSRIWNGGKYEHTYIYSLGEY